MRKKNRWLTVARLMFFPSRTFRWRAAWNSKDYGDWFSQRPRLARAGNSDVGGGATEPASSVVEQAAALGGKQSAQPAIDSESMRLLTFQAFCCGARGIEFASNSRLDAADNATRLRATSLALLNLELELVEPWGRRGKLSDGCHVVRSGSERLCADC